METATLAVNKLKKEREARLDTESKVRHLQWELDTERKSRQDTGGQSR